MQQRRASTASHPLVHGSMHSSTHRLNTTPRCWNSHKGKNTCYLVLRANFIGACDDKSREKEEANAGVPINLL